MDRYSRQPLGKILARAKEPVVIDPHQTYRQVTVRLFHKGVIPRRGETSGSTIRTTRQWLVRQGQVLLSGIDARNGAIGIVPQQLDGAIVTNDFWAFHVNRQLADPGFLDAYFGTPEFVSACNVASEGTTNRVRLKPDRFLKIEVPLPPIEEQLRITERIGALRAKVDEAFRVRSGIQTDQRLLLQAVYSQIIEGAEARPMKEVAPLIRRPVKVDPVSEYCELGIRSFGKGTFHKPPTTGAMLGDKRVFEIKPGDLLFNIVFAWEGAVSVARPEDEGRIGSHRFLTCVPKDLLALSSFLCFHFLTVRGLKDLGTASPGGAGRNRTLGLEALARIEVPIPPIEKQQWFASLVAKTRQSDRLRIEVDRELNALMPSVLSKAFRGEL